MDLATIYAQKVTGAAYSAVTHNYLGELTAVRDHLSRAWEAAQDARRTGVGTPRYEEAGQIIAAIEAAQSVLFAAWDQERAALGGS